MPHDTEATKLTTSGTITADAITESKFSIITLKTDKDNGYYAETADSTEKVGEVAFRSFFEKYADYTIEKYGIYVYKQANGKANAIESTIALANGKGYYTGTITDVPLNTYVYAMPYVVIDGKTYTGEMVNTQVTEESKWLGAKEAE